MPGRASSRIFALHASPCGAKCEQARAVHLTIGSQEAQLASAAAKFCNPGDCHGFLRWGQVLSEPGVNRRELRTRAKAVRKLGQAFYDVNRTPAQRGSATAVMEELASVMQVSHSCGVKCSPLQRWQAQHGSLTPVQHHLKVSVCLSVPAESRQPIAPVSNRCTFSCAAHSWLCSGQPAVQRPEGRYRGTAADVCTEHSVLVRP